MHWRVFSWCAGGLIRAASPAMICSSWYWAAIRKYHNRVIRKQHLVRQSGRKPRNRENPVQKHRCIQHFNLWATGFPLKFRSFPLSLTWKAESSRCVLSTQYVCLRGARLLQLHPFIHSSIPTGICVVLNNGVWPQRLSSESEPGWPMGLSQAATKLCAVDETTPLTHIYVKTHTHAVMCLCEVLIGFCASFVWTINLSCSPSLPDSSLRHIDCCLHDVCLFRRHHGNFYCFDSFIRICHRPHPAHPPPICEPPNCLAFTMYFGCLSWLVSMPTMHRHPGHSEFTAASTIFDFHFGFWSTSHIDTWQL